MYEDMWKKEEIKTEEVEQKDECEESGCACECDEQEEHTACPVGTCKGCGH
jgi:hypothetical protein